MKVSDNIKDVITILQKRKGHYESLKKKTENEQIISMLKDIMKHKNVTIKHLNNLKSRITNSKHDVMTEDGKITPKKEEFHRKDIALSTNKIIEKIIENEKKSQDYFNELAKLTASGSKKKILGLTALYEYRSAKILKSHV